MTKQQLFIWARKSLGVLLVISYLLAAYAMVRMQILPVSYLIVGLIVGGIVVGLVSFRRYHSRTRMIVGTAITILLIAVNMYIFSVGNATTSFINSLQDKDGTYEEYSIIAKKDRHIALNSNTPLKTALLKTDRHNELVKVEVDKRTKAEYNEQNDLTSLRLAMDNNQSDTAAIKSSYVRLLQENTPPFYQSIEVLATFTIKVDKSSETTKTDTSKPFILYISGIDTYGGIGAVARSDVNMIAVVNPVSHKILLVNTPRDYYVQLHGTTGPRDKLTHAGIYGIDMSMATLEDLYGVDINYYLRVNFASLTKLVDALGGITVYSDHIFKSDHYSFVTGYNNMDSKQALEFSRTRYAFAEGDRTRGENQQRVIEAIIRKMNRPETLINYQSILASLEGALQTNASSDEITAIINQQMNSMRDWQIESVSVDGMGRTDVTYSMGSAPLYVMEPDIATVEAAKQKIQQVINSKY
jgi:LCP family protein required for cell wall assembly